jgi:hypothetical protein
MSLPAGLQVDLGATALPTGAYQFNNNKATANNDPVLQKGPVPGAAKAAPTPVSSGPTADPRYCFSDAAIQKAVERNTAIIREWARVVNTPAPEGGAEERARRIAALNSAVELHLKVLAHLTSTRAEIELSKADLCGVFPFESLKDEPFMQVMLYTDRYLSRSGYPSLPGAWQPPTEGISPLLPTNSTSV